MRRTCTPTSFLVLILLIAESLAFAQPYRETQVDCVMFTYSRDMLSAWSYPIASQELRDILNSRLAAGTALRVVKGIKCTILENFRGYCLVEIPGWEGTWYVPSVVFKRDR